RPGSGGVRVRALAARGEGHPRRDPERNGPRCAAATVTNRGPSGPRRRDSMVAGVLIRCEPQREVEVLDALRKVEGLSYVYELFGRYDMVALIRSLDLHAASEVVGRIRAIEGVTVTETLVVRPTS